MSNSAVGSIRKQGIGGQKKPIQREADVKEEQKGKERMGGSHLLQFKYLKGGSLGQSWLPSSLLQLMGIN